MITYHFVLVNGGWRDDENFSECSSECGGGNKTKTKYCDNPLPSNGGQNCTCNHGDAKEINCDGTIATIQEICNEHLCPGYNSVKTVINN